MAESKPSTDSPATPGRLANLKNQLGAVDDLIMSTVLKSSSAATGTGELLFSLCEAALTTASLERRQGALVPAAELDQL